MNDTPKPINRLKQAVDTVEMPAGLREGILARIRQEQAQSDMNARLRNAVQSEIVPPFLEARIRNTIRMQRPSRRWIPQLVSTTAAAAIIGGFTIAYQLGHLRLTVRSQESYIASVSTHISSMMRVGLGDHLHCSVFRKFPKNPPATEEFIAAMGPKYSGLIPIVRSNVPESYRLTQAHQCKYHGRPFIHLSLMDGSNLLSLIMTRKTPGEALNSEKLLPALIQSEIPMYQASIQRFQMTAFETRSYMVYFVSDLPGEKNTEYMLAMAPQVKDFLKKLEL
jgi:hypothetical protein